jgi:hypothetical protein
LLQDAKELFTNAFSFSDASAVSLQNLDNLIEQLAMVSAGVDDLRGQAAKASTGVDALISTNQGKDSSLRVPSVP